MVHLSTPYHRFYTLVCLIIYCCFPSFVVAQQNGPTHPILEQQIIHSTKDSSLLESENIGIPIPPESQVRAMAEWEELEAIVLAWSSEWAGTNLANYDTLLAQITLYARQECNVNILCNDITAIQQRLADIVNITDYTIPITCPGGLAGTSEIKFIEMEDEFDKRIWIRDYGAHTIYTHDVDTLAFVDWKYDEGFGGADVYPSSALAQFYNSSLYITTENEYVFRLDGGNFLTDGMGNAFSSKIVQNENTNNGSPTQIAKAFMGIHTYHYQELPVLLHHSGARKHVDMYMKLLDEETILLSEGYPEENTNSERINQHVTYFESLTTPFDRTYKVERIIVPPDENGEYPGGTDNQGGCNVVGSSCFVNYTNALFINRTILVPIYNNAYDEIALSRWRDLMPGYKIVGINSSEIIRRNGAIHCVTKEIGVKNPLWITHAKIQEACSHQNEYEVYATIKQVSGIEKATVFYTTNLENGFQSVEMELLGEDIFDAAIPAVSEGTQVYYYIEAVAHSGKKMVRPMPAPKGYWTFEVTNCLTNQDDIELKNYSIDIFPNPAEDIVSITTQIPSSSHTKIQVLDIWGRVVELIYEGKTRKEKQNFEMDISHLPAGIYMLEIANADFKQARKLVVR